MWFNTLGASAPFFYRYGTAKYVLCRQQTNYSVKYGRQKLNVMITLGQQSLNPSCLYLPCNQKSHTMTSINKFALFCYNFPHNFIKECWTEGGWIVDHFESKFAGYYEQYGSLEAPIRFYLALDSNHKERLEQYIETLEL